MFKLGISQCFVELHLCKISFMIMIGRKSKKLKACKKNLSKLFVYVQIQL